MKYVLTLFLTSIYFFSFAQFAKVEGYIYETGNRGYINGVNVTAENIDTDKLISKTTTNVEGFFTLDVPENSNIRLYATKEMFDVKKLDLPVKKGKVFVKLEMGRMPGYTFEVTLAEKRDNENIVVDAIKGARIEVYNNTKRESVMDLKEHMSPEFQLNLAKGNHYTILIRKEGYLSKRMEAKVDVEGCILCFDGVGEVNPGVSDNLTENNAFGVLLANVELERIFTGKKMEIQNLLYGTNQYKLKGKAKQELTKVITLMKDNPNLTLELGSHTDSRGNNAGNQRLSDRRAKEAVDYLIMKGDIARSRVISKGYGENVLLNNCADGVKCSDAEHARNRRTELKIVGITNVSEIKSLKRMKEEEHMEEEILTLMDQKEVRAESIEELQNRLNTEASNTKTKPTPKPTQQEADTDVIKEVKESKKPEILNKVKEIKEENKTEEKITETKIDYTKKVKESTNEVNEVIEKPAKAIAENVTKSKSSVENNKRKEITTNLEPQFDDMPGLEVVKEDATLDIKEGVKVVLYRDLEPLSENHPIFKRHKNIESFRDTDKTFNYMIGGFGSMFDANKFYKSFIKPQYKGSFIATIKDGKMLK